MKPTLLFVLGPTASGKSDLAIEIAERAKSQIINCDSIQFFKGVEIGAAKPSAHDLARVPHHLLSHLELGAEYTAGDFRRDALKLIETSSTWIPTGGSGFYIQALEKGMYDAPEIAPEIRERLEVEMTEQGPAKLHAEIKIKDPETAEKIQPQDRYRILRALELLRSSNEKLSDRRARFEAERPPAPFHVKKLGLTISRERLRERITERTRRMLKDGLIDEVHQLRAAGFGNWAPLRSVGYKETQMFLDGELTKPELESLIITSTMQLAKRQVTWFKRDPEIQWFDPERDSRSIIEFADASLAT